MAIVDFSDIQRQSNQVLWVDIQDSVDKEEKQGIQVMVRY
jgi:hypothetical protein